MTFTEQYTGVGGKNAPELAMNSCVTSVVRSTDVRCAIIRIILFAHARANPSYRIYVIDTVPNSREDGKEGNWLLVGRYSRGGRRPGEPAGS